MQKQRLHHQAVIPLRGRGSAGRASPARPAFSRAAKADSRAHVHHPCPGCYAGHPKFANRGPFGIGRTSTLRAWLSMWSLETSKCQGPPQLAKLAVPALVVQSMADMGVFPSDARKIFNSVASADKTLELIPGAHYFEDNEANRERAIDLMAAWINERT